MHSIVIEGTLRFVLTVLATWRVTHLLANEDGPADLIVRFRSWLGARLVGRMMDCFNCLSLWIASLAAISVTRTPVDWLLTWLALSGATCLLERLGQGPAVIKLVPQTSPGESNYVLWPETSGAAE
jgi:hypothetical protein